MNAQQLKLTLQNLEAQRVPDTLDLWPAIRERVRLATAPPAPGAVGPTLWRWMALTWPVRLVLAASLLLAFLLIVELLPLGQQVAPASAAALLNRMAEVAAAQPVAAAPTDGYRYTKSEEAWVGRVALGEGQAFSVLAPKVREIWIAPDGSGRIRETAGELVFLGERDRARWEAAGSPAVALPINQDFGPGGLFAEDFSRYPTDPAALAEVLREQATKPAGPPVDVEMFVLVGDLLRQPGVPPELRAALFRVAAQIQGVELVGPATDRAGRQGIAVAMTTDFSGAKERHTLIIDPETSALLGEERVLLEQVDWIDAGPPAVIGYATYLESSIVFELP